MIDEQSQRVDTTTHYTAQPSGMAQHEEADTRIIFHINKILEQDPTQRVVVRQTW